LQQRSVWRIDNRNGYRFMNDQVNPEITTAELLARSVRIWFSRVGLFVTIIGIPMALLLIVEIIAVYAIFAPAHTSDLRELSRGLSGLKRSFFGVALLAMFAAHFRALAASVFAVQEIWSGRSVGFLSALRSVRRPQLRLFWIIVLLCVLPGPLGWLLFPFLAYFVAPGLPVAILESQKASAALKRGKALVRGRRGRIALLVILSLSLSVVGIVGAIWVGEIVKDEFGIICQRTLLFLSYWIVSLVPQWCMVALTLNFLDARGREEQRHNPRQSHRADGPMSH
jgi:hypothetical protein